ncbi:MAG: DUF1294 domain-containing protein [Oscillospiraceae bacterium]|nr:DUF1294 domain-containing protein [Oscillospiraceae bacterium]
MVFLWLLIWGLIAFAAMGADKRKAIRGEWRIPEKRLFLYAVIGGGIGAWLGMLLFRHKTRHWRFAVAFRVLALAELLLILSMSGVRLPL